VDDLYALLLKHDVKVVDPPADYPEYGEGYYAVFFLDPDGLKTRPGPALGQAPLAHTASAPGLQIGQHC
jgi:hypothetical protein